MRLECCLRSKSDCCPVGRQGLFLNLKSTLQDSLVEISPVPWQLGQIISPEPVHLAQSASPIVDNSGRLIVLFRSHARQSIVPTPSHLGQMDMWFAPLLFVFDSKLGYTPNFTEPIAIRTINSAEPFMCIVLWRITTYQW
jgi:hypothetical protein